ncbi:MAG: DUF4296 domain-containing protein [Bacteroidia bacterium]
MCKLISISILTLILTLFSCSEQEVSIPDEIISREQMVQILAEMHIADASINYKSLGDTSRLNSAIIYRQVLNKYSVSAEHYRESYQFYLDHPKLINKMYDEVINELSRRQSEAQNP